MSYKIVWDKKTKEAIQKFPFVISSRIYKKINELVEEPFSKIRRLKGINAFKLRVGDYRVILSIDVQNKIICVLKIGHRKNIYDNLK
ncbi:MAG: type II toxin-antitoxin system RelE/ParE family toxin [Nanoarchaeota archaeon]|nr:type II toxin-antitoxin system RelE/ParE family toxin [Nanoarchaeota archaeon]